MHYLRLVQTGESYWVERVEVPMWAFVTSWCADAVDGGCGHVFCGEGGPQADWYDPIRGLLYQGFTRLLFVDLYREQVIGRYPVSEEAARVLGADLE